MQTSRTPYDRLIIHVYIVNMSQWYFGKLTKWDVFKFLRIFNNEVII